MQGLLKLKDPVLPRKSTKFDKCYKKKNIEIKTIINSSFDIIYQLYMHIKLFWKNLSVSSFVKHNPDLKKNLSISC